MSTWRVVISGAGACYLVHVPADSQEAARRAARDKVKREHHDKELRIKSAERIPA